MSNASLDLRVEADPELIALLARGSRRPGLVALLKKAVPAEAAPTVRAVQGGTPIDKGQLSASIGITTKTAAAHGEVYSVVGIKDNITLVLDGMKTLFTSARRKRSIKLAVIHGASQVSSATAFKYVRGIESGIKSGGKLGRKAGGAHMFQHGADQTGASFVDHIGEQVLKFVVDGSTA